MKKTVKTVECSKNVYVAIDGTEFNSEASCLTYEQSVGCAAKKRLMGCVVSDNFSMWDLFDCGDDETSALIVCPQSKEDIDAINKYIAVVNKDTIDKVNVKELVSDEQIGTNIAIFTNCEADWCWIKTEKQILDRFNKYFHPVKESTDKD